MSSPLLQSLVGYIRLDKSDKTPIYLQIAQSIINAIHTQVISAGDKLPGTRALSDKLYVHRKTVIAAYDELAAQGWIDIIPQKGAFAAAKRIKTISPAVPSSHRIELKADFNFEKNIILDIPDQYTDLDLYFTAGTPDYRLTSLKAINQIFTYTAGKKNNIARLNQPFQAQNESLKQQILNYLRVTKGIHTSTNQICTTANYQTALTTVIHTLLRPKDKVIVTELGNFNTNMLLKQANIELIPVKMSTEDIDISDLEKILKSHSIRALYIQSNNLYPTTSMVSNESKQKLLELAHQHRLLLIEDDSMTNFVYSKQHCITLKSLDKNGSVVYINSFGDLLPSPYNLGFILAPSDLKAELLKYVQSTQQANLYLIEETLMEFIREGFLLRQWQKQSKIYQKRSDNFEKILNEKLDQSVRISKPELGLGYWLAFNQPLPLLAISNFCKGNGLTLPTYLLHQNKQITGIRLGFANLTEAEAEHALEILSKAIYAHLYK